MKRSYPGCSRPMTREEALAFWISIGVVILTSSSIVFA